MMLGHNRKMSGAECLADMLKGYGVTHVFHLAAQAGVAIELPSWAFGNSGTRFRVFPSAGTPRTVEEKIADAAQVNRLTGAAPTVALHIPWDRVDDYAALREQIDLVRGASHAFDRDRFLRGECHERRKFVEGETRDRRYLVGGQLRSPVGGHGVAIVLGLRHAVGDGLLEAVAVTDPAEVGQEQLGDALGLVGQLLDLGGGAAGGRSDARLLFVALLSPATFLSQNPAAPHALVDFRR